MFGDVSMGQITQDFINRVKEFELHQNFIKWSVLLKVISQGMT